MANHTVEIQHWQGLLEQHRRNAQTLREQLATSAIGEKRLDKLNQLAAEEDAIREAKAALRDLGEPPDHLPGDPPEVESFPDDFVDESPYPIAIACHRFNLAAGDVERFRRLDELLQHVIKYLAAIALAQYRSDSPQEEQLRDWLGALSRPSLQAWMRMLNEICDHYEQKQGLSRVANELVTAYHAKVGDDAPMARAHRYAIEVLKGKKAARQVGDTSPQSFFESWGAYSRRWEATDPGAGECRKLVWILQPALCQILERFTLIARYPLHYIERADRTEEGWFYTMLSFQGCGEWPIPLEEAFQDTDQAETPKYTHRRLYLCAPDGQPLLNLHPILISYLYHLYFLEYNEENRDICYRPCGPGEMFHPPSHFKSFVLTCLEPPKEEGAGAVAQLDRASDELEKEERERRWAVTPMRIMLTHLSAEGREALEIALGESLRIGHFWLGVEFLLMGLSKQEDCPLGNLLHELGAGRGDFRGALRGLVGVATKDDWRRVDVAELGVQALGDLRPADPATLAREYQKDGEIHPPVVTPRMMQVLRDAGELAGEGRIGHVHLLSAALRHPQCPAVNALYGLAVHTGWKPEDVPAWVAQQANLKPPGPAQPGNPSPDEVPAGPPEPGGAPSPPLKVRGILATCGRDLTDLAQHGRLRPAVGESAKKAMLQMGLILQQTEANNPILLGDPGVGKTAIVEGFVHRLATDPKVVAQLAGRRVVDLSPAALLAGTKYRGDLEQRLQQLVQEVSAAAGQIVVFIDEIHTILGGKAEGGLGAIADVLKPALARGEFPCIGATTVGEYRRYIETDPALARRFTPVWIEEPTAEEAVEIVKAVAQERLRPSHRVSYPDAVIKEAVQLSVRYLHDERLPGKAIKLLDQAGPRVVMGGTLSGREEADKDKSVGGVVTIETVREIVSERTGIPLTQLSKDDKQRLLELEERLQQRVKGQAEAVAHVARVIKRARAGLADPRRPPGVFLFAGPTGVGKTELALALAEALFDEEDAILRLDMSEYMEKHQVSRLIGSPPGYVGYEEEGQLTGRLRRRPYSVVLLDEVEKAHEDVQHLFLQLFDAGRLTDARGNLADGRNAIFVMTTNLGAKVPLGFAKPQMPSFTAQMKAAIEEHFTPEFLNRIDRIVYFEPLGEDTLLAIFDKQFRAVATRLREQGVEVEVAEELKRTLVQGCLKKSPDQGARPLQRAIEDVIVAPLTDKLLAGEIKPGTKVVVGVGAEWEMSKASAPSGAEGPIGKQPPPQVQAPLVGRPDYQIPAPADLGMDPGEARNREAMARPLQELKGQLRAQEIEITLAGGAYELLCSPLWVEQREGLGAEDAFECFVREPLMERVQRGEFQAGDRVEVYRNADLKIDFRKLEGEEQ